MRLYLLVFVLLVTLSFVHHAYAQDGTCSASGTNCVFANGGFDISQCDVNDPWSWNCDKCPKPAGAAFCPKPQNIYGGEIAVIFPFYANEIQSFYNDAAVSHERCLMHYEASIAHRRLEQESYGIIKPVAK